MIHFDRIIVVEDDQPTLLYSEMVLQHFNSSAKLFFCTSYQELKNLYITPSASKDLILLDMNLEDKKAPEILNSLKNNSHYSPERTKVLVLSSIILQEDIDALSEFEELESIHEKPLVLSMLEELAETYTSVA